MLLPGNSPVSMGVAVSLFHMLYTPSAQKKLSIALSPNPNTPVNWSFGNVYTLVLTQFRQESNIMPSNVRYTDSSSVLMLMANSGVFSTLTYLLSGVVEFLIYLVATISSGTSTGILFPLGGYYPSLSLANVQNTLTISFSMTRIVTCKLGNVLVLCSNSNLTYDWERSGVASPTI